MKKSLCSKEPDPPTQVCELIDNTFRTWKIEVVRCFFYPMDSEAILQIPLSLRKQDDCWAWHYEENGLFTVCSAYRMMIETKKSREDYFEGRASCSDIETRQKEWKHLWGMQLPSKIKVFCWRLALNSIPTGEVLKSRNLATSAECRICGAGEDSWEHALLHYTMSKCV